MNESLYYCVVGTIMRSETEVIRPGLLVGRSFSGQDNTSSRNKFSVSTSSDLVPAINLPTIVSRSPNSCIPNVFRGRYFSKAVQVKSVQPSKKRYVPGFVKHDFPCVNEALEYQFRAPSNNVQLKWLRVNKDEGNLQVTVPCFSFRAEKYDLSYLESIIMKTAAYFTTEQALFRRLNGYLVCLN